MADPSTSEQPGNDTAERRLVQRAACVRGEHVWVNVKWQHLVSFTRIAQECKHCCKRREVGPLACGPLAGYRLPVPTLTRMLSSRATPRRESTENASS